MKDFDETPSDVLKPEIGIVQKTRTEYKYVGTIRRKRGQTLFSFDPETKKIESVELQRNVAVGIDGKPLVSNKVTTFNPKLIYFFALNMRNAIRKLQKRGFSDIIVDK